MTPPLDIGRALPAAGLGLEAVGIDAPPTAIDLAEGKASERGLEARFVAGDALPEGGGRYFMLASTNISPARSVFAA